MMTADKPQDRPFGKTQDKLHGRKTLKVANLLDEFEKDDIRKKVDIVDLFSSFGIELKKKGKSYVGICPWHNDNDPSLSVDKEKGLYNCFGCGESGDAFSLVEKMKGLSFKEAIEYLKKSDVGLSNKKRLMIASELEEKKSIEKEADKRSSDVIIKAVIGDARSSNKVQSGRHIARVLSVDDNENSLNLVLNTIADHYHKRLFASINGKAIEYLKKRGLKSPELYTRFKIGYAPVHGSGEDGSLLDKIGEDQKKELLKIGILNEYTNGGGHAAFREHFENCVIFPIQDDIGNIVGMYGRNINDNTKLKHLYLKGEHKGVFNRKASKVYNEIILTESIIDCLSLVQMGIENAQSVYGTNGFTEEHLQTLKDDRVKLVVIAFDNDEAGSKAGESLKAKLSSEGFSVKVITPPVVSFLDENGLASAVEPKDWNDYLVASGDGEEIKELVNNAEIYREQGNISTGVNSKHFDYAQHRRFTLTKDNINYTFTFPDIIYRVSGIKDMFIANLRVNIKAEQTAGIVTDDIFPNGDIKTPLNKFFDNLDLYSARSRTNFSSNLSRIMNIEPKRIEKDLIDILEYIEEERDRKLLLTGGKESYQMTAEEIELGMNLLRDLNLYDRVIKDMDIIGYVGEDLNKQLIFTAACTRKMDDPISVMIVSQSASGKTRLVETVESLIPPEDVISVTSLSDQALNYVPDMVHKFLILGEAVHGETVEHQLRELLSSHRLSRLVTTKDEKTGKMESEIVRMKAVVSCVMTGTNYSINPENASRSFIIDADESVEQTKRIHEAQRRKYTLERYEEKSGVIPEIIKAYHAAGRLLRKIFIVNAFAEYLKFPDTLMRTRRDHERFLDLIAGICFVRQYQKEVKTSVSLEYIECDIEDYRIAYEIMMGTLMTTFIELPKGSRMLYEEIREYVKSQADKKEVSVTEIGFIQKELREYTGLGSEYIKKHLRTLVDFEYIQITSGKSKGTRLSYRLRADEPLESIDLSMIPNPDEMGKLVKNDKTGYSGYDRV
jgi:DNA primase